MRPEPSRITASRDGSPQARRYFALIHPIPWYPARPSAGCVPPSPSFALHAVVLRALASRLLGEPTVFPAVSRPFVCVRGVHVAVVHSLPPLLQIGSGPRRWPAACCISTIRLLGAHLTDGASLCQAPAIRWDKRLTWIARILRRFRLIVKPFRPWRTRLNLRIAWRVPLSTLPRPLVWMQSVWPCSVVCLPVRFALCPTRRCLSSAFWRLPRWRVVRRLPNLQPLQHGPAAVSSAFWRT